MTRTTTWVAACLAGGALALGGCSSSPTTAAPPSTSQTTAIATATTTATTATTSATVDAAALGKRITAAMRAAKTGKATTSSAAQGQSVEILQQFAFTGGAQPDSKATMSIAGLTLDVVSHDSVVYMKGFPAQMTGGKVWVKVDPNGSDQLSKALKQQLGNSPQDLGGTFTGGTASVLDTSNGNTRYKISGITVQGVSDLTMELTVDGKDLPVSSLVTVSGQDVKTTYSDWGAPVSVEIPAADQVGTLKLPTG